MSETTVKDNIPVQPVNATFVEGGLNSNVLPYNYASEMLEALLKQIENALTQADQSYEASNSVAQMLKEDIGKFLELGYQSAQANGDATKAEAFGLLIGGCVGLLATGGGAAFAHNHLTDGLIGGKTERGLINEKIDETKGFRAQFSGATPGAAMMHEGLAPHENPSIQSFVDKMQHGSVSELLQDKDNDDLQRAMEHLKGHAASGAEFDKKIEDHHNTLIQQRGHEEGQFQGKSTLLNMMNGAGSNFGSFQGKSEAAPLTTEAGKRKAEGDVVQQALNTSQSAKERSNSNAQSNRDTAAQLSQLIRELVQALAR